MGAPGCATSELLEDLVNSRLSGDARAALVAHLSDCERCARLVAELLGGTEVAAGPLPLQKGGRLGRYVLLDPLGKGGMGTVYSAFDPLLERRVAIKVLHPHLDLSPRMLMAEARAMARLAHPNVVPVFELGTGDVAYLVMELVEGESLAAWLETPRPWRQVLDRFLQAGEALCAAHAAGLVHGDFKPANVLLDAAGRARVTDFGLAQPSVAAGASGETAPRARGRQTPSGSFAGGTPAYMSPERFLGEKPTAACDQFAFSASLFEALYGRRPYAGRTYAELEANVLSGQLDVPGSAQAYGPSPKALRRLLVRGLAREASDRWPSLDTLLGALRKVRTRTRRFQVLAATTAVATCSALLALGLVLRRDAPACEVPAEAFAGVWDGATRERVRAGLARVAPVFAGTAEQTLLAMGDAYVAQWRAAHQQACEATRVQGHQSEALLTLRMQCLDDRRSSLRALVGLLSRADAAAAARAVDAAAALPSIDDCAELSLLRASMPQPQGEAERQRWGQLRELLEQARLLRGLGKPAEALDLVQPLLDDKLVLGFRPAAAEVHAAVGEAARQLFQHERAERHLAEAVWTAEAAGAWALIPPACAGLALVAEATGPRHVDAERWLRQADAVLERLGRPAALEGRHWEVVGEVHRIRSRPKEAVEALTNAVSLNEAAFGRQHPRYLGALLTRASLLENAGRPAEAEAAAQEGLEGARRLYGDGHPEVANALVVLAKMDAVRGRHREVVARLDEARAIYDRAFGAENLRTATVLNNQAVAWVKLGDPGKAEQLYRDALALRTKLQGETHPETLLVRTNVANMLLRKGRFEEGLVELSAILTLREEKLGTEDIDLAYALSSAGHARLKLGRVREALGDYERAVRLFDRFRPHHPDLVSLLEDKAECLLALGRFEQAVEVLERAVALADKANLASGAADRCRGRLAKLAMRLPPSGVR